MYKKYNINLLALLYPAIIITNPYMKILKFLGYMMRKRDIENLTRIGSKRGKENQ